ncbi:hypothetical protein DPMN_032931 [Dreissena polymorpha]|uniref:Uncharacterized protein n=1 Tax=Dreissena polymorpha TaxID=45954 RepID=A0A9D4RIF7_DREPO|nr:hypothetical protein DPMN_032931 [Dreissena polymorpha]
MSNEFFSEFGCNERAYLMMFSHYVPCTLASHQCASLIGQYAAQSEHRVVVGYKDIFEDDKEASNEKKAKKVMIKHGALVIFPGSLATIARKLGFEFNN